MSLLAKWFGFSGVLRRCVVAAVGVYSAFGVPWLAEEKASPLVFFLLNHWPGQSFDADAWGAAQSLVALKGDTLVTHSTSDVGKLPRILEAAKDADPREKGIVLSTAQIDVAASHNAPQGIQRSRKMLTAESREFIAFSLIR